MHRTVHIGAAVQINNGPHGSYRSCIPEIGSQQSSRELGIQKFPKQPLTDGVLTDLYKRGLGSWAAPFTTAASIFYCNLQCLVTPTFRRAESGIKINGTFAF